MIISELRRNYHSQICQGIIRISKKRKKGTTLAFPNFADGDNTSSRNIAWGIVKQLNCPINYKSISGQLAGSRFERITSDFLERCFGYLQHLRPGEWIYSTNYPISSFEQYEHLEYLERVVEKDSGLRTALGGDYIVKPDIVIGKRPVSDEDINQSQKIVSSEENYSIHTPFRQANQAKPRPILHASISCKWTIRSDRAQNTRTEALNLIRNRKGATPHIVAVTAEPLPSRLITLAMGTGDLDCVYHFALNELEEAIREDNNEDQLDLFLMMVAGKRLRDISDLPFDLAL